MHSGSFYRSNMYEVGKVMERYDPELIRIWIDDTINEKISSKEESLIAQGEARGEARGEAIGMAKSHRKMMTNLMNSDLTPEMKDKALKIINS